MTASIASNQGLYDQAADLRELMRAHAETPGAAERESTIVAVTSGKGGVGKTNLAVNLGVRLQGNGMRVTLADLDVGMANADVLLGVQPQCGLREVLSGRRGLDEVLTDTEAGLRLLAGASGPEGISRLNDADRLALADRLCTLDGDVILLDCAAGIQAGVISFARVADVVLVVTTPEPTALTDAYATIKTLNREGYSGSIRLVVNMVDSRIEAKEVFGRISGVCEKFIKFPIADAGYLLHDTFVELAVRQRAPFVTRYPRCSASACVNAIAARLLQGRTSRATRRNIVSRVVGMFT